MKKNLLIISILLLLNSCDDKSDVLDKHLHEGLFDGKIGRHHFAQANSEYRNVITKKGDFNKLSIEIKLDGSGGQHEQKFVIYNRLNIHLNRISKDKTYLDFGQKNKSKSPINNTVNLLVKEQFNSSIKSEEYICIPEKKKFTIKITDVGENNNLVKGTIDGFLFNINNPQDSILISAKFITD